MPKLRRIIESPPEPKGDAEQQIAALREYIALVNEELEYILTHIELENTNFSFTDDIKEQMPKPYTGRPEMDGIASPGTSAKWSRGNHKHGTDITRAAAADLNAHVGNTANPHGVTKDQVGLGNVANERQYSAQNPPPLPTPGGIGAIPTTEKGNAGGVAELDSNGMVPSAQLPSYVDDVLEYLSLSDFPVTGESGKIYVAQDTNKTYRWSGSAYVEISESLALGETSSTAYRGDRGKTAYDHSQTTTGNPHNVSASDVGLGNVDNVQQYSATNPPPAPDADDVPYDNTGSGLMATDVQAAIDELAQGGGGGTAASAVSYDNTGSGLTATNVQDAIDEVYGDIPIQPSDIGAQDTITANGILKGDGAGGVSAAVAGTDYQAPLTAGTDYATPTQLASKANQAQLAYPESGTTASRNYSAGEYICWNGSLYTADTAIASGATFYTSGGNKNLTECAGGGFNSLFTKTPKYTHFEIVSASSVDHLIKVESSVIIITNTATHTTNGSSLYYGIVSATNATYSNLIEVQKDSYRPTTVTAGAGKITITTTQNYIHVVVIECPT